MYRLPIFILYNLIVVWCFSETPLYRAVYNFEYTTDSINGNKRSDCLYLDLNGNQSLCYSYHTFQYDSLMNTPTGSKIWEEIFNKAIDQDGYKATSFPKKRNKFKVLKNYTNLTALIQDEIDLETYEYTDSLNNIEWHICDSVSSMYVYNANLAIGNFHGRTWKVWFTTELPWNDGPWMLFGLPGLIIKATDSSNLYTFNLLSISECGNHPTYWCKKAKKNNKKGFLKKKI